MLARLAKPSEMEKVIKWSKHRLNRKINFHVECGFDKDFNAPANDNRVLIIDSTGKLPLGVVIFERGEGEVSIFMCPGRHSQGLGYLVLLAAEKWIRRYYLDEGYLWVDCCSEISAKTFVKAGYKQEIDSDYYKNL